MENGTGHKLHIDTAEGDIPVTAILIMSMSGERVTYLYDLADAAYCSGIIREVCRQERHVPLIDHNARQGEKIAFATHEAERYQARSQAKRVNSLLKGNNGGYHLRVRGASKVYTHLEFGILVVAAEQLLRLFN
mgnify:CR=1 FL=1